MKVSVDRLEAEVELVEWVTLCTASVKTTAADGHHVPARRISLFYRMSLVSAISQVLTTQRLDNWLAIYVAAVRIATTSLILAAILLVLAPDKVGITAWALIYGWPIHRADRNVLHAAGAANDAAPATASPTDHPSAAGGGHRRRRSRTVPTTGPRTPASAWRCPWCRVRGHRSRSTPPPHTHPPAYR